MKNKIFKTKINNCKEKKIKKNKLRIFFPSLLEDKLKEKQLKMKNKLKTKFFSYYFKKWNTEKWPKYLPTKIKPQYPQNSPYSIKNTKFCILTKKFFVTSNSNINSHSLKFLVGAGEISNLKKSIW